MTTPSPRQNRRKAHTRASLVRAAQEILATGPGDEVSIQHITEKADVGFGSFYNHFDTKADLFEVAILQGFEDHATHLETLLAHERDPAVVFAASLRLTGRLHTTNPVLAGVLRQAFGRLLFSARGLAPRARRDLVRAAEGGRFMIPDPDAALACAAGALAATLHLLSEQPTRDVAATTDAMVAHVLLGFGLDPIEVDRIVSLPLPGP